MYYIVPKSVLQNVVMVLYGIIVPLLVIMGLVGNIMTFFILKREQSKTSTTYLLFALTCADMLYMVTTAFDDSVTIAKMIKPKEATNFRIRYLLPLQTGGWSLPSYISNWVVVMISLERAIAVLFPLKAKRIWTKKTSIVSIVIACLLPTLSTCPRFLQARGVPVVNNVTNEVSYRLDMYYIPGLDREFFSILRLINTYMLYVGPVCIVLCANICIIVGLYCSTRWFALQFANERQTRDNRVSRMMFLICLQFCLCVIPYASLITYNVSKRESKKDTTSLYDNSLVEMMYYIFYILLIWNSAMNFIIYVASSSTFRKGYVQMLCVVCLWRQRKSGGMKTMKATKETSTECRLRVHRGGSHRDDNSGNSDVLTRSETFDVIISDDTIADRIN